MFRTFDTLVPLLNPARIYSAKRPRDLREIYWYECNLPDNEALFARHLADGFPQFTGEERDFILVRKG